MASEASEANEESERREGIVCAESLYGGLVITCLVFTVLNIYSYIYSSIIFIQYIRDKQSSYNWGLSRDRGEREIKTGRS